MYKSMHTRSINYRPFIISPPPREIPSHAKNENGARYQNRVIHVLSINRHLRRPEAEEENNSDVEDSEQVDSRSKDAWHVPRAPAKLKARSVRELGC